MEVANDPLRVRILEQNTGYVPGAEVNVIAVHDLNFDS